MEQQIQNFQKIVDELKTLMGERASELIEKSLILVFMGSNDYINSYLLPLSDKCKTHSLATYAQLLMHHYNRQLMVKREKKNNKYLSYFFFFLRGAFFVSVLAWICFLGIGGLAVGSRDLSGLAASEYLRV